MVGGPLFTIIIPTYNRAHLIGKTIGSVLDQTYSNFEVIIVDDGSVDLTENVVREFKDYRIKYFKKKNEERSIARNFGIRRALGQYVTFLDSDDILYKNHFQEAANLISIHKEAIFFHLAYEVKSPDGVFNHRVLHKGNVNKKLLCGNMLSCIGVFVKKSIIQEFCFNEDRNLIGAEDWELWVRLAARYKIYYSNKVTSCLINHDERSVVNFSSEKMIKRIMTAYSSIFKDEKVCEQFGQYRKVILSHLYLYLSLHLLLVKDLDSSKRYLNQSIVLNPRIVFTYKFMVLIYKRLINKVF